MLSIITKRFKATNCSVCVRVMKGTLILKISYVVSVFVQELSGHNLIELLQQLEQILSSSLYCSQYCPYSSALMFKILSTLGSKHEKRASLCDHGKPTNIFFSAPWHDFSFSDVKDQCSNQPCPAINSNQLDCNYRTS